MHTSRAGRGGGDTRGQHMRIRNFPQQMDAGYVDSIWKLLEKAIQEIQRKNNSGLSFEELYRNAYTMVLHRHGDMLYKGMKGTVEEHLRQNIRPTIMSDSFDDSGNMLHTILNSWTDHKTSMQMIKDILMYMDRVYVPTNSVDSVETLGVKVFNIQICQYPKITENIRKILLKRIDENRNGEHIEQAHEVKEICNMLMSLGVKSKDVYSTVFENEFLRTTEIFYKTESDQAIESLNSIDYVTKVNERLKEEDKRTKTFLDSTSCKPVKERLIKVMIRDKAMRIVKNEGSGAVWLIDNQRFSDLKNMHELLMLAGDDVHNQYGTGIIMDCLSDKLFKEGMAITKEFIQKPDIYIQKLMQLKSQYDYIIDTSFKAQLQEFRAKQTQQFEKFVNHQEARTAEYLVIYIDSSMKSGRRAKSDTSVTESLKIGESIATIEENADKFIDQVICIFRLISDKDTFERHYKSHLSKRILDDKNKMNEDAEHQMICKLKSECGSSFTTKLEQMFKDKKLYQKNNEDYKTQKRNNTTPARDGGIDIDCKILTSGQWPSDVTKVGRTNKAGQNIDDDKKIDDNYACYLPEEMQLAYEDYKKWYLNKQSGRKLTLLPNWGQVEIKFKPKNSKTKNRTYTIITTTILTCVLAKFNGKSRWSIEELKNEFPDFRNDIMMCIVVLTNARHPVLRKLKSESQGDVVSTTASSSTTTTTSSPALPSKSTGTDKTTAKPVEKLTVKDEFEINEGFESKTIRVKIMPQMGKKKGEDSTQQKATKQKIEEDRKHEIEAAIVRIMKARKIINHNNLVAETIEQLSKRFKAQPSAIKAKIEALIEREYIKRDANDKTSYSYVA
jgi:cullin 3